MMMNGQASSEIRTVGVIGAGRMGQPIIGHLARKGFAVSVYDIDPGRQSEVEKRGGRWCADTAALARDSDAILICVGYDHELRELISERGLLKHAPRGAIIAILSTVLPETVQELSRHAGKLGVHLVDATVCRGSWAADEGTLLSFIGGGADIVARLRPVVAAYSSDIVHIGGVGAAQAAKAVNNLILWACLVADHEGLALAHRYGLDIEALRKALLMSSAANHSLETWGEGTMAWANDDLEIVIAMAQQCGISLPQAGVVREICRTLKPRRYQLDKFGL